MSDEMGWCYGCQEPRPVSELENIPLEFGNLSMVVRHCQRCREEER